MTREEFGELPPRWRCCESRKDGNRLYYGRFHMAPLRKGQAEITGIAMRKVLLGELEGTCIIGVKFQNAPKGSTTIKGVLEPIYEILANLKEIVFRSNLYGVRDASIRVKGPKCVTAKDIILPPSVEVVDETQHIAKVIKPIDFCIELQIKRDSGYDGLGAGYEDESYLLYPNFNPVINAGFSIYTYEVGNAIRENILFIEIWTNGSLTPREALYQAAMRLIDFFMRFLFLEEDDEDVTRVRNRFSLPLFLTFKQDFVFGILRDKKRFDFIYMSQLGLPSRTYYCLEKAGIRTFDDFLTKSPEDILEIEDLGTEDLNLVLDAIEKYLLSNSSRF